MSLPEPSPATPHKGFSYSAGALRAQNRPRPRRDDRCKELDMLYCSKGASPPFGDS